MSSVGINVQKVFRWIKTLLDFVILRIVEKKKTWKNHIYPLNPSSETSVVITGSRCFGFGVLTSQHLQFQLFEEEKKLE